MYKGYSLHIGVNSVNPKHYGSNGRLSCCQNDALYMQSIMKANGFRTKTLLTENATRKKVSQSWLELARNSQKGDFVIITYSGHGSFIPDMNGDESKDDQRDETWCLYDAQLVDDEIYLLSSNFKEGVRVLIITDSCHNKSIYKNFLVDEDKAKAFDEEKSIEIFEKNKPFYEAIQQLLGSIENVQLKCGLVTLAACKDDEKAKPGFPLSEFTQNLKDVWNNGVFKGDHEALIDKIRELTPTGRTPQISFEGNQDHNFIKTNPFKI
ncbi:caspase family protein [Hyunsoonleella pacifica]|uniref:Caspase family protein n=1 Tax=Hyunsoonleella pacifica TaxID=1080224 RepID=A0A4Q9FW78_9FLAO|nr:caspase family protein [Hyunsoonleella pacifica]TBN18835.1 caspase family protein [Hyunsoonleella pacifica]GGD05202.1 hypothetical protein GCM10011368_03730 [Hyunsoonleella pacifica]